MFNCKSEFKQVVPGLGSNIGFEVGGSFRFIEKGVSFRWHGSSLMSSSVIPYIEWKFLLALDSVLSTAVFNSGSHRS